MDTSNITRTTLADGDLVTWIWSLEPERREDFTVLNPGTGAEEIMILAQVGRALIQVTPDGMAQVSHHGHDSSQDEECWAHLMEGTRDAVEQHNAAVRAIQEDPRAQFLARLGVPISAIVESMEQTVPPAPTDATVAPVPMPVMSLDDAPGFYL